MTPTWKPHRHVGAYGVCLAHGQILVIHKARGPYEGLWDLPGGTIEHGESPEETVVREFIEETGLKVAVIGHLPPFSKVSRYTKPSGTPEEVHHLGFLYLVETAGPDLEVRQVPDGLDSLGARWLPLDQVSRLSPLAEHGVRCLRDFCQTG